MQDFSGGVLIFKYTLRGQNKAREVISVSCVDHIAKIQAEMVIFGWLE